MARAEDRPLEEDARRGGCCARRRVANNLDAPAAEGSERRAYLIITTISLDGAL